MLSLHEWMRHQCVMRACRLRLPDAAFGCFRLLSQAFVFFFGALECYMPLAPPPSRLHTQWRGTLLEVVDDVLA